jgi:hypothetical protein
LAKEVCAGHHQLLPSEPAVILSEAKDLMAIATGVLV